MRSYKAARRAATLAPVQFEVGYDIERTDEDGVTLVAEAVKTFTCRGTVSSLMLAELARNASTDVADPEAMELLAQCWREAFADDVEYRRFFRFRTEQSIDDEQLMEILAGLMEDFAGRPTVQPSHSRDGLSTTGPTSKGGSSREVTDPRLLSFTVLEGTG